MLHFIFFKHGLNMALQSHLVCFNHPALPLEICWVIFLIPFSYLDPVFHSALPQLSFAILYFVFFFLIWVWLGIGHYSNLVTLWVNLLFLVLGCFLWSVYSTLFKHFLWLYCEITCKISFLSFSCLLGLYFSSLVL